MSRDSQPPADRLSRSLLLPGPLPPHTHFGVTLLRHVVVTGLRSALHRLGLPLIDESPVQIVDLRLYLGTAALAAALGEAAGAAEAVAALVDPGGSALRSADRARLTGAAVPHRARLFLRPSRRSRTARRGGNRDETWRDFRRTLTGLMPVLNDAVLAELLASLARRRHRAAGRSRPPCLGREAWRLRTGRRARLACLGPPEPMVPSWAADGERAEAARAELAGEPLPPVDRFRGRFRERYRAALDDLATSYRLLADDACERGLLDNPGDAFFIPFDLAEDLTREERPAWLAAAVAANRREYLTAQGRPSPADTIDARRARTAASGRHAPELSPLLPLP